jgi:nucleotide-binding universal stress UspA family protein
MYPNKGVSIRNILIAHDFSETADHALAFGLDLAERFGASVTVVHAYEVPNFGNTSVPVASPEMIVDIERMERSGLDALAARTRRPGVEMSFSLRRGPAADEIVVVAKERGADLIVMGTHGRRGFSRWLMGSVAERVVRTAPCPVLTMHLPQPGDE